MKEIILSNSEINHLICSTFKSTKDQNIVRDRIINGFTFDEIISAYFPDFYLSDRSKKKLISLKIIPLLNKYHQAESLHS